MCQLIKTYLDQTFNLIFDFNIYIYVNDFNLSESEIDSIGNCELGKFHQYLN